MNSVFLGGDDLVHKSNEEADEGESPESTSQINQDQDLDNNSNIHSEYSQNEQSSDQTDNPDTQYDSHIKILVDNSSSTKFKLILSPLKNDSPITLASKRTTFEPPLLPTNINQKATKAYKKNVINDLYGRRKHDIPKNKLTTFSGHNLHFQDSKIDEIIKGASHYNQKLSELRQENKKFFGMKAFRNYLMMPKLNHNHNFYMVNYAPGNGFIEHQNSLNEMIKQSKSNEEKAIPHHIYSTHQHSQQYHDFHKTRIPSQSRNEHSYLHYSSHQPLVNTQSTALNSSINQAALQVEKTDKPPISSLMDVVTKNERITEIENKKIYQSQPLKIEDHILHDPKLSHSPYKPVEKNTVYHNAFLDPARHQLHHPNNHHSSVLQDPLKNGHQNHQYMYHNQYEHQPVNLHSNVQPLNNFETREYPNNDKFEFPKTLGINEKANQPNFICETCKRSAKKYARNQCQTCYKKVKKAALAEESRTKQNDSNHSSIYQEKIKPEEKKSEFQEVSELIQNSMTASFAENSISSLNKRLNIQKKLVNSPPSVRPWNGVCPDCGRDDVKHYARGRCTVCYRKAIKKVKKEDKLLRCNEEESSLSSHFNPLILTSSIRSLEELASKNINSNGNI